MIFSRASTEAYRSLGTVITGHITPSMRILTRIQSAQGSKWMSLAFSAAARSMMELTNRTVGAAVSFSSTTASAALSCWVTGASRRISWMARWAPSPPYRLALARSMPSAVVIMGTTRRWVATRTSSWAIKFRGSLMARYRVLPWSRTGVTPYFLAMFRGSTSTSWGSGSTVDRSTNSMPSCKRRVSMSCCSVMIPSSISSSPSRFLVSFCRARAWPSCS